MLRPEEGLGAQECQAFTGTYTAVMSLCTSWAAAPLMVLLTAAVSC